MELVNGSLDEDIMTFIRIQILVKNSSYKPFQSNPVKKTMNHILLELTKVFMERRVILQFFDVINEVLSMLFSVQFQCKIVEMKIMQKRLKITFQKFYSN